MPAAVASSWASRRASARSFSSRTRLVRSRSRWTFSAARAASSACLLSAIASRCLLSSSAACRLSDNVEFPIWNSNSLLEGKKQRHFQKQNGSASGLLFEMKKLQSPDQHLKVIAGDCFAFYSPNEIFVVVFVGGEESRKWRLQA